MSRPLPRRTLVAGALALSWAGTSGCSVGNEPRAPLGPTRSGPTGAEPSGAGPSGLSQTDLTLVRSVVAAERQLLDQYAEAVRHHPQLEPRLRRLIGDHRAHLRVLGHAQSSESTSTGQSLSPQRTTVHLAALARSAAKRRIGDSVAAESGELARLLASIGACEAQHVHALMES